MEKANVKKATIIRYVVLAVLVIGTVLIWVFNPEITNAFNKNVSANEVGNVLYHKVPALLKSIQIVTLMVVAYMLIRLIAKSAFKNSNRGYTICSLLISFLKWLVAIVAILLVLHAWGVDTGTLLASAGILSLVVGLGAQSLVEDIIAGLFIVFEGEYQVGDIVVIDDWRGTVKNIGIRTTQIVDAGGNIKIINNSDIRTIVNQTQELSVAKCTVGIEYDEAIPHVEMVIRDNLDKMRENIPAIVEGPFYKGVTLLNSSSIDLLFVAKCKEEDIYQVQRDLNREIKLLFDANGVGIPFPQVVVNQPTAKKKKATGAMIADAKEFVDEQKELSKNIEEKP